MKIAKVESGAFKPPRPVSMGIVNLNKRTQLSEADSKKLLELAKRQNKKGENK